MRAEAIPKPLRAPRGHAARLETALLALAGGHGEVLEHRERGWASITFAGTRHHIRLAFEGAAAIDGGEALIAALPDHEFALPGRLVADATVSGVDHTLVPAPRMAVSCEVLLLEDG